MAQLYVQPEKMLNDNELIFNGLRGIQERKIVVLTIAGFDPSSGAGVTADLKTVAAHGLYGTACITAVTVQTSQGVSRVDAVHPGTVREILEALLLDMPPAATKIGMLGSGEVARGVATFLKGNSLPHVVLDPVLRSSSGAALIDEEGIEVLRRELLGLVDVIAPNLDEASLLTGTRVNDEPSMEQAARKFHELGAKNVVIKGGHLPKPLDLLSRSDPDGGFSITRYVGEKVDTANTHGTGCAFSTALACNLARGVELRESVRRAKDYVSAALRYSYSIGKGPGSVNHLFRFEPE